MPNNLRPLIHQDPARPGETPKTAASSHPHPHPHAHGHGHGHGHGHAHGAAEKRKLSTARIAVYGFVIIACAAGGVYFLTRSSGEVPPPEIVNHAEKITEGIRKAEAAAPPPPPPTITPPPPGMQGPKSAKSKGP